MIEQEGKAMMGKHGDNRVVWRSKIHLNAREARMFDNALVLMGQQNHEGGSPLEKLGLILNEQISCVLGE